MLVCPLVFKTSEGGEELPRWVRFPHVPALCRGRAKSCRGETVEKPLRWVFLDSLAPACGPVSPIFCEKSAGYGVFSLRMSVKKHPIGKSLQICRLFRQAGRGRAKSCRGVFCPKKQEKTFAFPAKKRYFPGAGGFTSRKEFGIISMVWWVFRQMIENINISWRKLPGNLPCGAGPTE